MEQNMKTIEDTADDYSRYSVFFDESCFDWTKDPAHNLMFLRRAQERANKKLKDRGSLSMNDVYELIGVPKTPAGRLVGWLYDPKTPIDFGIYNVYNLGNRRFVNGLEATVLLDFNCKELPAKYIQAI